MLRNIFLKTLWDQRRSLTWWAIGLIALGLYMAALYPYISTPEFRAYMESMPPAVLALLGATVDMGTAEGYVDAYVSALMGPLLLLVYGIVVGGAAIAGEEEKGTLDVLLANPLRRWQVVIEKFAAMIVGVAVVVFFMWLGLVLGFAVSSVSANLWLLAQGSIAIGVLGLTFGALALALGCIRGSRGFSAGIAAAAGIASYLINNFAPMVAELKDYQRLSLLYYCSASRPMVNGLDLGHTFVLLVITVLLLVVALVAFERRDLAV